MNILYTDQGIKNVCKMIKHIRAKTSVGELFMIAPELAELWAGTKKSILDDRE